MFESYLFLLSYCIRDIFSLTIKSVCLLLTQVEVPEILPGLS
jgi:hypothetical protein